MKKKTKAARKYASKALQRSGSSWSGMYRMLQLLARAKVNVVEGALGVSHPIASVEALEIIGESGKI